MYSIKDETKTIRKILLAICALFFLICLFSILKYGNTLLMGSLEKFNNDDVKYIRSAWILADTGNFVYNYPTKPTVFAMPGITFALAFFVKIFGKMPAITAFRIFQAFVQTLSLYLVFLIGRKLFNSKVALTAVILNFLCIAEIYVANLILTETLFKFLVLNLIYISIYAVEKNKTSYYVFGGLVWGLAVLFRPTIATYPIIILLLWIVKKYTFKDMFRHTLVVTFIFCIVLSPWWIRNYKIYNKFIPLTMASGNPMLQGTYIHYNQNSRDTDGLDYSQFQYPDSDEIACNEVEVSIAKFRLKNLVPRYPLQYLYWYTIGKTVFLLYWPFYWVEILGVNFVLAGLYHYFLLMTGILGMIKLIKDRSGLQKNIVIPATITYFIVVYLPFYTFGRYFYPAMPFLIMLSASYLLPIIQKYDFKKHLSSKKFDFINR